MTVLDQGSAMVGERESGKARQTEPGHGTAVLVRRQRLRARTGAAAVKAAQVARSRELRWLVGMK